MKVLYFEASPSKALGSLSLIAEFEPLDISSSSSGVNDASDLWSDGEGLEEDELASELDELSDGSGSRLATVGVTGLITSLRDNRDMF